MNIMETTQLLATAALVDNRNTDDRVIMIWHEILEDIDFTDAMSVLREFFRTEKTAYLRPAHIHEGVRELEKERLRKVGFIGPDPNVRNTPQDPDAEHRSILERKEMVKRGLLRRDQATGQLVPGDAMGRRELTA